MLSSYLSWRAGRGGLAYPVAVSARGSDVELRHGDLVRIEAGAALSGVVDLTGSVLGGALAVLVTFAARDGAARQIPVSILPGMALELVEVD